MRLITIFLLCISLLGLSIQAEAQEAIFVYGKGTCTAVDIQNVNEIKMTEETIDVLMLTASRSENQKWIMVVLVGGEVLQMVLPLVIISPSTWIILI